MVELNIEAAKESVDCAVGAVTDLLATKGNSSYEKTESATKEAVDATETHVAKATDKAKEIVKKATEK